MTKYSKVCKDFEAWESKDLNNAELAYYIDVQARVRYIIIQICYFPENLENSIFFSILKNSNFL